MFDLILRPLKEQVLHPLAKLFAWLHPTTITLIGFVFGLISSLLAAYNLVSTCIIYNLILVSDIIIIILTQNGWSLIFWLLNRYERRY